jgi:hypothetical protein
MKDADHLRVSFDRHRRDGVFRREFQELDAHLHGECATSGCDQAVNESAIEMVRESRHVIPYCGGVRGVGSRG